jgi:predicted RNase H-like nuclease
MSQKGNGKMATLLITGFDSAWGGTRRGAMCDLWIDKASGKIEIKLPPVAVTWSDAIQRVTSYAQQSHHILAIDQGLVVPNHSGMRPVDKLLAKALGAMQCSAYPANRQNESCYGTNAGIWALLTKLEQSGYVHQPMSIPGSTSGKFYFECYPHPAIIALQNRTRVLKYKCRHCNQDDWKELVDFLSTLPVTNLSATVEACSSQNKGDEDKLDSIVCAYIAVLWWQHGTTQSSMLGNMIDGYIVTPHSEATLKQFRKVFGKQINDDSGAPTALPGGGSPAISSPTQSGPAVEPAEVVPVLLDEVAWAGPVELVATDTGNLSRNMKQEKGKPSIVINDWMDQNRFNGYRLIVKLLDEDAEPEVAFVPHLHSEIQKVLMADRDGQPGLWFLLVAGASKKTPLRFRIKYRYQQID